MNGEKQPVYFMDQLPEPWLETNLGKIQKLTREALTSDIIQNYASKLDPIEKVRKAAEHSKHMQAERWFRETGVPAEKSYFSVIMPIHDEKAFLPSVLSILMVSDIPEEAHIKFIFVTNGCTDDGKSQNTVRNHMKRVGNYQTRILQDGFLPEGDYTSGLESEYAYSNKGNVEFIHVDTAIPSKANALNIGNKIAKQHGPIAMCLDANDFPDIDTIKKLYGSAYKHIVLARDGVKIVNGTSIQLFRSKSELWNKALSSYFNHPDKPEEYEDDNVTGGLCAWDTEFVDFLGGFPEVAVEDYGLGAIARLHDAKILTLSDTVSWKYYAHTLNDLVKVRARFIRGFLQLISQFPETEKYVNEEFPYTSLNSRRFKKLIERIRSKPSLAHMYIIFELIWLDALNKGIKDFETDPHSSSWEPILATKT